MGASADVADKIAKRLVSDFKAAKLQVAASQTTRTTTVGVPATK